MQVPGAGLRALRPRPSERGGGAQDPAAAGCFCFDALGLVAVAGVAHLSVGLTGKDAHSPQAPNNFFDAKEEMLR
jgi:hypothetical protein